MGPQRTATPVYTCTFPGCPAPVKVSLALVASLQDLVRETEGDLQGILHGARVPGGIEVRGCRPVASFSPESMERPATEKDVIGYYRVRRADVMQLSEVEVAIAEKAFDKPGAVVLLIQRRDGVAQGNFFFREQGGLVNLALLTFPLDARLLEERSLAVPPPAAVAVEEAIEPVVEHRRRSWAPVAAGMAALAAGLAGGIWFVGNRSAAPANKVEMATPATPGNAAPLPLRAERQGDDLKVIWDLGSAQIANAISGVLDIDDGGVKRRIPLDERQVRFGSVLYTPRSEQVSIDFTALKPDGSAGQASVLVLLTRTGTGARPTEVRNVVTPNQDQVAHRRDTVAPAPVRQFVPPPETRTVAAPRDADSMPSAVMKTQPVATVQLPVLSAPAPPPSQQPANGQNATAPQQQRPANGQNAAAPPQQRPPARPAPRTAAPAPAATDGVYYPPQLLSQIGARVPQELRGFVTRPFTVTVRATIDETGRVIHAETPQQKVIHVGFLSAATEAAMRCRFQPARRGNTPVKGEALLTFRFQ